MTEPRFVIEAIVCLFFTRTLVILAVNNTLICTVTRFGEISPLWPNLKSFGQLIESLFSIWQTFEPGLTNFVSNWAISYSCYWPNIENNLSLWSHC